MVTYRTHLTFAIERFGRPQPDCVFLRLLRFSPHQKSTTLASQKGLGRICNWKKQEQHGFKIKFGTVFLMQSIQVLPTHKFKPSLHQLLLRILKLEDTHVDTPTLINKLSKVIWKVK